MSQGETEHLHFAIDAYTRDWEARKGDYRWHGINLVALLKRAERDGVTVSGKRETGSARHQHIA